MCDIHTDIASHMTFRIQVEGCDPDDLGLKLYGQQFAGFQSDAPACDSCGAITVRNDNCYLCHNCGQSMGCS